MSKISLENEIKKYNINDKLVCLEMNILTNVEPEECFDFTKNYNKNIHIVIPSKTYSEINQIIEKRVNKNSGIINFYSYAGGKPVSQLMNGHRKLSKIVYPPYSSTLLSSIKIPQVNNGDILYILIDSYSEFLSISQDSLKRSLIEADTNLLIENILNSIQDKDLEIKFIIDHTTFENINLVYSEFSSKFTEIPNLQLFQTTISNDKINNYLCDDIFGKLIGGQQQLFNGTLIFKDHTIIDVYNNGKINIALRGSGLSLIGNGTSKIFIILEKECEYSTINITEYTTGMQLFEENTLLNKENTLLNKKNYEYSEINKYSDIIIQINDILTHNNEIQNILSSNNNKIMKDFMITNSQLHTELELLEIEESIVEENTWYYKHLKLRLRELVNKTRFLLDNIRKHFDYLRKNNESIIDFNTDTYQNICMQRQQTCGNDNKLQNKFFQEYITTPPILKRN